MIFRSFLLTTRDVSEKSVNKIKHILCPTTFSENRVFCE